MCSVLCLGVRAGIRPEIACHRTFLNVPWQSPLLIQLLRLWLCGFEVLSEGYDQGFRATSHTHGDPHIHKIWGECWGHSMYIVPRGDTWSPWDSLVTWQLSRTAAARL